MPTDPPSELNSRVVVLPTLQGPGGARGERGTLVKGGRSTVERGVGQIPPSIEMDWSGIWMYSWSHCQEHCLDLPGDLEAFWDGFGLESHR